jgi:hypothetical protein
MNTIAPYPVTLFHNFDWKPHSHEPSTLCEDKVVVMVKNHELAGHGGSHLFLKKFYFIHMCIQWLGHFYPLSLFPPLYSLLLPSSPLLPHFLAETILLLSLILLKWEYKQ